MEWTKDQYLAYERKRIAGKSRKNQNVKIKASGTKVSANKLTQSVIDYCTLMGYHVQRNNTMGVFDGVKCAKMIYQSRKSISSWKDAFEIIKKCYRKSYETRGSSDLLGYCKKTGRFLAIEIKVGKDTIKGEQQEYIDNVNAGGGIGIICRDTTDAVIDRLSEINDMMKNLNL